MLLYMHSVNKKGGTATANASSRSLVLLFVRVDWCTVAYAQHLAQFE